MFKNQNTFIAAVVVAFIAVFATTPSVLGDNSSRATPMKFVGTFFGENSRIVTYSSDGTITLVLADMFTEDPTVPNAGRKTTPLQGVWRKVGSNKIQVTTLGFQMQPFGHNYNPGGFIIKTKWLAVFDDAVNGVSPGYTAENITVEAYLPGQNPTSDDPVFGVALPDAKAYRLTAE